MAAALDLWLFACAREREEEAVRREAEREEAARQGDEVLRRVAEERDRELGRQGEESVSYTHLTLPTICSV